MIVLGNILSLVSNILAITSTRLKDYKKMLLVQSVDTTFSALANLILGGYSGALISICGLVRNLYCALSKKTNKIISFGIIAATFVISMEFTFKEWYDILPILASTSYGLIILNTNDIVKSKIALIINCSLWIVYGAIIYNFIGIIFKTIMITSTTQSLIKMYKDKKGKGEVSNV